MREWEDYLAAFGERLKEYRVANNLTLRQLEVMTRINSSALSRVEKGREFPSSSLLHALAECDNCDIDYLITGRKLVGEEYVYLSDTLVQADSLSSKLNKVTVKYMIYFLQMQLASYENESASREKYDEYTFNLKLAEIICERYDDRAEEGQVIYSIRKTLDVTMQQMADILGISDTRYRYMENHGGIKATELVELYDKLKVNPAFVLSGRCERLIVHADMLKRIA